MKRIWEGLTGAGGRRWLRIASYLLIAAGAILLVIERRLSTMGERTAAGTADTDCANPHRSSSAHRHANGDGSGAADRHTASGPYSHTGCADGAGANRASNGGADGASNGGADGCAD